MQANSLKDLLQSKIDDLEKQVLSRVNSIEEGKVGLRNETEQRGRVESTLTSLHQRITDLEKGELGAGSWELRKGPDSKSVWLSANRDEGRLSAVRTRFEKRL